MTTIFALATPPGRSGVAVIRISGPEAAAALSAFGLLQPPKPRMATLCTLHHPISQEAVDKALVLWFPSPDSFTGEDVAELHLHGSRAVIEQVGGILSAIPSIRLAEPGEFSRRAFLNGKLDLTQAEAIADLIDADTAAQARQALRQVSGHLRVFYDELRQHILHLLAMIEAYIDFPDEEIPETITAAMHDEATRLTQRMLTHLNDKHQGEKLREGLSAVIFGAPNAGKSSLLNCLARNDIAIVSSQEGTTRDVIEVQLELAGYPITLADTAGLRQTNDPIEQEGIRRAHARIEKADIKLALFDASRLPEYDHETLNIVDETSILILNKVDIAPSPFVLPKALEGAIPVSAMQSTHIEQLLEVIQSHIEEKFSSADAPVITRLRHRVALEKAVIHLQNYLQSSEIEFACEELRQAANAIGSITASISNDDVLDVIFRSFCIGK